MKRSVLSGTAVLCLVGVMLSLTENANLPQRRAVGDGRRSESVAAPLQEGCADRPAFHRLVGTGRCTWAPTGTATIIYT